MGTVFKDLREEYNDNLKTGGKRMTQMYIADKCHMSKSVISKLENGKYNPTLGILNVYHETFKVPYDYLLGVSKAKQPGNVIISQELGLTDGAIETLKFLKEKNDDQAFFNAFLEDKDFIEWFTSCSYTYLYDSYLKSGKKPDYISWANKTNEKMVEYLFNTVLPKILTQIEKKYKSHTHFQQSHVLFPDDAKKLKELLKNIL